MAKRVLLMRHASSFLSLAVLALAACGTHGSAPSPYGARSDGVGATNFPVSVHSSGRYLVDASGAPWRMHGDTAWSLIAQLNAIDQNTYLADRQSRGVNVPARIAFPNICLKYGGIYVALPQARPIVDYLPQLGRPRA